MGFSKLRNAFQHARALLDLVRTVSDMYPFRRSGRVERQKVVDINFQSQGHRGYRETTNATDNNKRS